jgi:hypothetical protein
MLVMYEIQLRISGFIQRIAIARARQAPSPYIKSNDTQHPSRFTAYAFDSRICLY